MASQPAGAYGPDDDIVDYILGITFEIWEQRQVDLIHRYYAKDCVIWGLDGITHGAQAVVDATAKTLECFPDRLLIAEDVIWSHDADGSQYSSHRLHSTATNTAATAFGPATGERIRMTNIADCVIENGMVTREWLVRDNLTLALQLGAEPLSAARKMAAARTDEHGQWLADEITRVAGSDELADSAAPDPQTVPVDYARWVLNALWGGNAVDTARCYAPYCVLHRSPLVHVSGRDNIARHYERMRFAFGDIAVSVDHVAVQPHAANQVDLAVRWTLAGTHRNPYGPAEPSGRHALILGVSHWRCLGPRIVMEHTVFDELALLSQLVAP
ncbi:MAG: ester cyclase [Pseudomonadota bacterium]